MFFEVIETSVIFADNPVEVFFDGLDVALKGSECFREN